MKPVNEEEICIIIKSIFATVSDILGLIELKVENLDFNIFIRLL